MRRLRLSVLVGVNLWMILQRVTASGTFRRQDVGASNGAVSELRQDATATLRLRRMSLPVRGDDEESGPIGCLLAFALRSAAV